MKRSVPPPPPPLSLPLKEKSGCARRTLGLFMVLGAILVILYAFAADSGGRDYEATISEIAQSMDEDTRGLESIAGETASTAKAKQSIDDFRDQVRDHADRRESDRLILLIVAGVVFVVGALFIR